MTVVLACVLQLASLTLMWRISHAYPTPAEDGGSNRKETETSAA